jgi:hypothetical protein
VAAAYASIVQKDLFSDFFAYRSMAKDVDASEATFVAPCLLPLWRIRVFAAESAWALVSASPWVSPQALE